MENITVNKNIRLEPLNLLMAETIFNTIVRDRDYLETWLPFIEMTNHISDTENFIKSVTRKDELKKDEIFSIWYKEEFAGLIGFKDTDWINMKTEIGYWLAEKMQGKGIMTACVKKLISYAYRKLKMNRIQIKVAVGNTKSAAIPQKLEFQFEGIERSGELHKNKFLDLQIYSLLRSDFQP